MATTIQAKPDQLHTLFFSKAKDLFECELKYYWRYHRQLVPKQKNLNLLRGGYVHSVADAALTSVREGMNADQALGLALLSEEDKFPLPQETLEEAKRMMLSLWSTLLSPEYEVEQTELQLAIPLLDDYVWRAKLDGIIKTPTGLWQAEYKTTSRYASNIRRLYHSGIQPFTYLYVAGQCGYELQGTKMFVANAKECFVEDVVATPEQLAQAERFIDDTLFKVQVLEKEIAKKGCITCNRTQCVTLLSECVYRSLSLVRATPQYLEDTIKMMYDVESPLAHYGEK